MQEHWTGPGRRPGNRRLPRISACVVGVLVSTTACAAVTAAPDDNTYSIGVITSQTGSGSQLGVGELQGAQQAVAQINAAGGINGHRVQLIAADDQSNPAQAALQARKMLDQVDAVVGPSLSGPCRAVLPLATSARIVNYCLSPGIEPKPDSWQWSASADTKALAERVISYWKKQGITRIGLTYSTDASGVDGAKAVRHAVETVGGVQITASAAYSPSAVSVTSQVQTLAAGKPEAIVVWSTGAGAAVAFKGLEQAGLTVPVATTDGNLTYTFLDRVANYLPDTLLIPATQDFWWQQSTRGQAAFDLEKQYHETFQAQHGQQPDFGPGVAYDATMLVARALGDAGGDRHGVKPALENMRGVAGVVGTYSFSVDDHRGLTIDDVAIVRASRHSFDYVGR
jgi:branched-chain amino acid transport system substrate-binding protein